MFPRYSERSEGSLSNKSTNYEILRRPPRRPPQNDKLSELFRTLLVSCPANTLNISEASRRDRLTIAQRFVAGNTRVIRSSVPKGRLNIFCMNFRDTTLEAEEVAHLKIPAGRIYPGAMQAIVLVEHVLQDPDELRMFADAIAPTEIQGGEARSFCEHRRA